MKTKEKKKSHYGLLVLLFLLLGLGIQSGLAIERRREEEAPSSWRNPDRDRREAAAEKEKARRTLWQEAVLLTRLPQELGPGKGRTCPC